MLARLGGKGGRGKRRESSGQKGQSLLLILVPYLGQVGLFLSATVSTLVKWRGSAWTLFPPGMTSRSNEIMDVSWEVLCTQIEVFTLLESIPNDSPRCQAQGHIHFTFIIFFSP